MSTALVVDAPDLGPGCGWAGDVVEALEGFIVGAGAGFENEAAGDERQMSEMFPPRAHSFPLLFFCLLETNFSNFFMFGGIISYIGNS